MEEPDDLSASDLGRGTMGHGGDLSWRRRVVVDPVTSDAPLRSTP